MNDEPGGDGTAEGPTERRSNFIRTIIDDDLAQGKYGGEIVTRFPPEPNGYLHIGHSKAICLNFGIAADYGGTCHLRFDDTNPLTEETEFVESIEADVRWLGFDWGERTYFASDFFEQMYQHAVRLIEMGRAYVDSSTAEEIREMRGSVTEPGRNSPYRDRPVPENLDLFARMRAGEFGDGEHVLRAKIDMASPNMLLRDPLLYRIRHATHHRTGDAWCIYPMYDFAHCLEDAFEGVSHSLCTLEFEINRALYDWVLDAREWERRPRQIEFARLELSYTVMSKRYNRQLVEGGHVSGWDDPRMPTLAGLRRRGVTPEAIRALCDMVGVAKANSTVDLGKLEFCIREDLNTRSPRVMCVLRPLKVVITNYPGDATETLDAPYWPSDVGKAGSRPLTFAREIYIDRDDFAENPPKKWFRLAPDREVRLRYAYVIRCEGIVRDDAGEIVELRCTYDPDTRHGNPTGRKVRGTLHWVGVGDSLPCEVRLYDRLFVNEKPGSDPEVSFLDELNPGSLETLTGPRIEPGVAGDPPGSRYQFERTGYFCSDPVDSAEGALVYNRAVTLKDSWAKIAARGKDDDSAPRKPKERQPAAPTPKTTIADERAEARAADPRLAERFSRYQADMGLDEATADRLTGDFGLGTLFEEAVRESGDAAETAKWVVNELLRELKDTPVDALPFDGGALGVLVRLVADGTLSVTAGKEVFAELMTAGGDPEQIVADRGLAQVSDASALEPVVDRVIADHPDHVARYRSGKSGLIGFFVGQVMKASGGNANPQLVRSLLERKLSP